MTSPETSEAEVSAAANAVIEYLRSIDEKDQPPIPLAINVARAALTAAAQVRAQAQEHCEVCGMLVDVSIGKSGIRKGE